MKWNKCLILIVFVGLFQFVYSQEYLAPLRTNEALKFNINGNSRSLFEETIISLPLVDDFSYNSKTPQRIQYPDTIYDSIFYYNYFIDTLLQFDSNQLEYFSFDGLNNWKITYDSLRGSYFTISDTLKYSKLITEYRDSISGELDSFVSEELDIYGFSIVSITIDSVLSDAEFPVWYDTIRANQSFYDSIILSMPSFWNTVKDPNFFDSDFKDYSGSLTIDKFYDSVYINGVWIAVLKASQLSYTVSLAKEFESITVQKIEIDTFTFSASSYDLWLDDDVFINRDYPILPPSIGVATFDGADENGNPYSSGINEDGGADSLTSNWINLSRIEQKDSLGLAFFIQPKGLGDLPNENDSFLLEFKDYNGNWRNIWGIAGNDTVEFRQILIKIDTNLYFHDKFQFRFRNYATLGGMMDHWHLDYVRMSKNFSIQNDSTFSDIAIQSISKNFLNEYVSVPWSHYDSSLFTSSPISIDFHSNMKDESPYLVKVSVQPNNGGHYTIFDSLALSNNLFSPLVKDYTLIQNSFLPFRSNGLDSADFDMVYSCFLKADASIDFNPNNDSIRVSYSFKNQYAYDDGSAEMAYGISSPVSGSKVAIRYNTYKTDTLRGVYVHWAYHNSDLTNEAFKLFVWDSLDQTGTGEDEVLLENSLDYVAYEDSINGWTYYGFDTPIVIQAGAIFIGWEQESLEKLNFGFDRNTDASSNLFYNTNGVWINSKIAGSVMFRPAFGSHISLGLDDVKISRLTLYPNPANNHITIDFEDSYERVVMLDLLGREVLNAQELKLDVSALESGLYVVQIYSQGNIYSEKVIIE